MKKFLSILLVAAMAITMLAGCGEKNPKLENTPTVAPTQATATNTPKPTATPVPTATPIPVADAEELPKEFAHITFDMANQATEGYKPVKQDANVGTNTGATYGIVSAPDANVQYTNGCVGDALYIDGKFGIDLGLKATNTDCYTVSFWMNADRLSTYGPTLQMGYQMGMAADVGNDVTWFNVTQSEWGDNSAKIFPIVWSRNEASDAEDTTDCWPWMYAFDNTIHGKKEWVHVTIVCNGETFPGPSSGAKNVAAQYFINGNLVYDSLDNYKNGTWFEFTWDAALAPNIMQPGDYEFQSYFGINFWDTVFKGYVDDLWVFDQALTPGQVQSLYQMGQVPEKMEVIGGGTIDVTDDAEPTAQVVTEINPNAMAYLGKTTCDNGWWIDGNFSDGYALNEGEKLIFSFKNYGSGLNNWTNYLFALANTQTQASLIPGADNYSGYAEYAVIRSDAYGWGDAAYAAEFEYSWAWDQFLAIMKNADVTLTLSREDGVVTAEALIKDENFETYTYKAVVKSTATKDSPMYVFLLCEGAYIELNSVNTISAGGTKVGAEDFSTGWWQEFSDVWAVPAGETVTKSFTNYHCADASNWNNFLVILQNTAAGHSTPEGNTHAEVCSGYAEYAVVRADNYGWGTGYDGCTLESNWNWDTFLADMQGAKCSVSVVNNGETADILCTIVSATGAEYYQNYKGIKTNGDLFFCLGVEKAFLVMDEAATVGAADFTTGWWQEFSPIWGVGKGQSVSRTFTNYHCADASNWNNFLVILQNTPSGHSTPEGNTHPEQAAGYAEYAVLRADNYGWGTGYDGCTLESNWNWDTFLADMQGAVCTVTVTNNGETADVLCKVVSAAGTEYYQNYKGIKTNGDLFFCLGVEKAYLVR